MSFIAEKIITIKYEYSPDKLWERVAVIYAPKAKEVAFKKQIRRAVFRNVLISILAQINHSPALRHELHSSLLDYVEKSESFDGVASPFIS